MKTLDRRMVGYGDFHSFIEFRSNKIEEFIEIRNWCWQQWGPSCELEFWKKLSKPNPSWCWLVDDWKNRIYLVSPKEIEWFYLRWGSM